MQRLAAHGLLLLLGVLAASCEDHARGHQPEAVDEFVLVARVHALDPRQPGQRSAPRVLVHSVPANIAAIVRGLCEGLYAGPETGRLGSAGWHRVNGYGCIGRIGTSPRTSVRIAAQDTSVGWTPGEAVLLHIKVAARRREQVVRGVRHLAERMGASGDAPPFEAPDFEMHSMEEVGESLDDPGWWEQELYISSPPDRLANVTLR